MKLVDEEILIELQGINSKLDFVCGNQVTASVIEDKLDQIIDLLKKLVKDA